MITAYLKDKQLRRYLSRIARCLVSLFLFVFAMVFAFAGQYDRACFDRTGRAGSVAVADQSS